MIAGTTGKTSNHLSGEKSPYLLQHLNNPVDWYPWGEAAFQKAKKEDKPVFLSIGYATCHWCHVMAHESFEDEEVARILNRHYVSIKVDREERPDIDKIYMSVCQSMTGQGGWPLTILMTPEAKPFFAGTYFPKLRRMNMPGLIDILKPIADMWGKNRHEILKASDDITNAIQPRKDSPHDELDMGTLQKGYDQFERTFDSQWGGFGTAPKFPTPHQLTFLLRQHRRRPDSSALKMVDQTLTAMRRGGIFDQVGFGFHRYSVDAKWLVPHFEKMLYDQALLAMAYIEAYQVTREERFAKVAKEIFTYVLRDMRAPNGGFYSAEDADSEGEEGLFYIWKKTDIMDCLGENDGDLYCRFYGITQQGNFEEGFNIPHISLSEEAFAQKEGIEPSRLEELLSTARGRLFEVREKRIHPLKDDKILTSWNGLMIAALSKGYQAMGDQRYADAAAAAADFILSELRGADDRLFCRFRDGDVAYPGYLDDYAFLVWGLIELYEATFDVTYLEEAVSLNKAMIDIFWDHKGGGLYFTGKGNETLITKSKEAYDGALPSGNSVAAQNLLRLGRMTGDVALEQSAEALMRSFSSNVKAHPIGYTQMLAAVDFVVGPSQEIVIAGDLNQETSQSMIRTVQQKFLPNKVILFHHEGPEGKRLETLSPFVKDMRSADRLSTAYVCEQHACRSPVKEVSQLNALLH
ncbi:MAG: thioredoxin domain-containing protein [Thermodesulfobacteriota bacterium]|nr:thioredoxin domain-containing protein [Thermodesulfobacteriota bacterium]